MTDSLTSVRKWKPYPNYKDSSIEWIDKVPNHWDVLPLFILARERKEKNNGNKVEEVLSLSYGKIVKRDVAESSGLLPESFETYQILHPGNIVLRLTDLQNDKRSLRVGLVEHRGIITSAYIGLELFSKIHSTYAYYLLYAYDVTKVFYTFGGGVRQSMKFEDLKHLPILCPPIDEQQLIAVFLDSETRKIDNLISGLPTTQSGKGALMRLSDLLHEYRTSLIYAAVTGKIDVRGEAA